MQHAVRPMPSSRLAVDLRCNSSQGVPVVTMRFIFKSVGITVVRDGDMFLGICSAVEAAGRAGIRFFAENLHLVHYTAAILDVVQRWKVLHGSEVVSYSPLHAAQRLCRQRAPLAMLGAGRKADRVAGVGLPPQFVPAQPGITGGWDKAALTGIYDEHQASL